MRILSRVVLNAAFVAYFLSRPFLGFSQVDIGDPPPAPTDLSGLPGKGPKPKSVTGGFIVNTDSREEVRSFYDAVYKSSDGVPMNTTANTATCTPGTNSTAFKESVLRRINWFRAMAGIPASVTLDATENAKDQEAAVLMSRNNFLTHFPTNTLPCFTANAANAASNSNIALGNSGADAISAYIRDDGTNNTAAGHRRWLLYPQTQVMGTGDVPQQGGFAPANATWITDANYGGPRPATRTPFVSWPPAGFVPNKVVHPRWSFSFPAAIFTNAIVTMKSNGVSLATTLEPLQSNVGESTLVWYPTGLDTTSNATVFPFSGTDTVYSITVTNFKVGVVTTGFTYTVTLFDPNLPGADYFPPIISGPSQPYVGQNNAYTFTPITNATGYEWRVTRVSSFSLSDGAETGLGNFTANTSAGYSVQDNNYHASGTFSFLLAHSQPVNQTLTLNQTFVPKTNGTLNVKTMLGYAGDAEAARIQVSTDGGVNWLDIYATNGIGNGLSGPIDATFINRAISLAAFAGKIVQLRFAYNFTGGNYVPAPQPGFPVGWYLDDLVITNAELWTVVSTNMTATTNFTFVPAQATNYSLNVRAYIFTEFPLDWGPAKSVAAISNTTPYIVLVKPVVTNNQVRLDFIVSNAPAYTFKLLQADLVNGPWTTNGSATLTTNVPGSSYRFTATPGPNFRFYRVQTP